MLHQRFSLSEARPPELVPSMNAFEDPLCILAAQRESRHSVAPQSGIVER
jgi:hypothetical protein